MTPKQVNYAGTCALNNNWSRDVLIYESISENLFFSKWISCVPQFRFSFVRSFRRELSASVIYLAFRWWRTVVATSNGYFTNGVARVNAGIAFSFCIRAPTSTLSEISVIGPVAFRKRQATTEDTSSAINKTRLAALAERGSGFRSAAMAASLLSSEIRNFAPRYR